MLHDLLILYSLFFRMGAVTFGGGYAMLPILRREIVQKHQWMDEETIMDYYALSQGLPGIIAINVSVFIGYKQRKTPGAVAAALGMVSPCIIIISKGVKDTFGIVLCLVMLALSVFTDISPILLVITCALLGVAAKWREIRAPKEGDGK